LKKNTGKIALGGALFFLSLIGMGYVQSLYPDCDQLGEILSQDSTEFPTVDCMGFNIVEGMIIFAAFVGLIVVGLGFLDK